MPGTARRTRDGAGDQPVPAWWVRSPPRVGVSSCLLGQPVRYNGGHKNDRFLSDVLGPYVEWVPVCPEVEVGMGTPRATVRLENAVDGPRMVAPSAGRDYTRDMTAYAARRVRELDDLQLCGYVLKSKSPSCGLHRLPVYEGGQVSHREGRGLFAAALVNRNPLLAIDEEIRLGDPEPREHFIERVYAHARLRELFGDDWRQRDLVDFHARHKLQLMAHDPARAKRAGQIVAAADAQPAAATARDYTAVFRQTLAVLPPRGRHVNALQHALGQIGEGIDDRRRRDLLASVTSYQEGDAPLSAPIALLQHHAKAEGLTYLPTQTYFEPFPPELGRRDHTEDGR